MTSESRGTVLWIKDPRSILGTCKEKAQDNKSKETASHPKGQWSLQSRENSDPRRSEAIPLYLPSPVSHVQVDSAPT